MCKNTKRTILSLGVERIAQTVGFIISRFLVVLHFRQLREILLYHHYYIVKRTHAKLGAFSVIFLSKNVDFQFFTKISQIFWAAKPSP